MENEALVLPVMELSQEEQTQKEFYLSEMRRSLLAMNTFYSAWREILTRNLWTEEATPEAFLEKHLGEAIRSLGGQKTIGRVYQIRTAALVVADMFVEAKRQGKEIELPFYEGHVAELKRAGTPALQLEVWEQAQEQEEETGSISMTTIRNLVEEQSARVGNIEINRDKKYQPTRVYASIHAVTDVPQKNMFMLSVTRHQNKALGLKSFYLHHVELPYRQLKNEFGWRPPLRKQVSNVLNQEDMADFQTLQDDKQEESITLPLHPLVMTQLSDLLLRDPFFKDMTISQFLWYALQCREAIGEKREEWESVDIPHSLEAMGEAPSEVTTGQTQRTMPHTLTAEEVHFSRYHDMLQVRMTDATRHASALYIPLAVLEGCGFTHEEEEENGHS